MDARDIRAFHARLRRAMPAHDGVNVIGKCSNRLARLVDRPGAKVCGGSVYSRRVLFRRALGQAQQYGRAERE